MAQARDLPRLPSPAAAAGYWIDAWQRSVLFLEVMRRRAAQYEAHAAEVAPNVLDYRAELVLDGRAREPRQVSGLGHEFPPTGQASRPDRSPLSPDPGPRQGTTGVTLRYMTLRFRRDRVYGDAVSGREAQRPMSVKIDPAAAPIFSHS